MSWHRWFVAGMALLIVGCGSNPAPVPSPLKTVTWTWTPGSCMTQFRLFEVLPDTQHREVVVVTTPTYTAKMIPRKSVWIVSGVCEDQTQYFSSPVVMGE